MRFTSLGSGSQGNALLVEAQASGGGPSRYTRVLVDCGLGLRLVQERLAARGLAATDLDMVFVTHEHADHIGGVARLARHASIPVFATHGTLLAAGEAAFDGVTAIAVSAHQAFDFQGLQIRPVPVPHDAREPVSLVFEDAQTRFAVVTDLGSPTVFLQEALQGLSGLFLEFNHDRSLLEQGDYPPSLKSRVGGDFGHLSNEQAGAILAGCLHPGLEVVVAAHLSQNNNHPSLVRAAVSQIDLGPTRFEIALQETGSDWISLSGHR